MPYSDIDDPSAHFQTKTYSGNGSTQSITNDGNSDLQPDWVWIKSRSNGSWHSLQDSSRGATKTLFSNTTNAEVTYTDAQTSFDSDGFSLGADASGGSVNVNSRTYVAWQWKANGGTTSSNTDGSVTSTVQVNQDAGFSIITYTGTGGGETLGHGLGVAPDMWIVKRRSGTGSWAVGFNDANILGGTSKYLILQGTGATSTYNNFWGSSPASSTVMRIAGDTTIGGSGSTYVAYAFAAKQGYSKFGKYVGNSNANGPFIYLGFKPAFVMIKRTDAGTDYSSWAMFDNKRLGYNPTGGPQSLYANRDYAEGKRGQGSANSSEVRIDMLSNGFKVKDGGSDEINDTGDTYIFMAFAQNPFVSSTGIPTTAR